MFLASRDRSLSQMNIALEHALILNEANIFTNKKTVIPKVLDSAGRRQTNLKDWRLTYSFSRFARICLMRPSRCPDWVFGTNSFRMVLVTLGCSLFEASFSRRGLARQAGFKSKTG